MALRDPNFAGIAEPVVRAFREFRTILEAKFNPTPGHKHTGIEGDGPKIDPSAFNTANWPAFRAYQSSAQSLSASTWTKIVFQTEVFDQGNIYDPSTGRFTAPANGIYLISASVGFTAATDGVRRLLTAYVNGVEHTRLAAIMSGGPETLFALGSAPLKLTSGDYVEIWAYSGTAENTVANAIYMFAAVRVA